MRGMSNREAAKLGMHGGTVMDEVKAKREEEKPARGIYSNAPVGGGARDDSPSHLPSVLAAQPLRIDSAGDGPVYSKMEPGNLLLGKLAERVYQSVLDSRVADHARVQSQAKGWENPASVEVGQIWRMGPRHERELAVFCVAGDGEYSHAYFIGGVVVRTATMIAAGSDFRCIGFQLPNGQRVMVGEVRAFDYTHWTITEILAGGGVGATRGPDKCYVIADVLAVAGWPLDVEATRRAQADRINREGVPVMTIQKSGERTSETRVAGVDLSMSGRDLTRAVVVREDSDGHRRIESVHDLPPFFERAIVGFQNITLPPMVHWTVGSSKPLVSPGPHARMLADLAACPHGPGFAGPHVEPEPPPRDHDSEARGLCLGIPWMFGESDQAYSARLDVEEARQVAQKILPDLARPVPLRSALLLPFEAAAFTAPSAKEIRNLADSLQHLEAELSRGMRDARAIDEALAGYRLRSRRTGPGWLRPALDRYVAERARCPR